MNLQPNIPVAIDPQLTHQAELIASSRTRGRPSATGDEERSRILLASASDSMFYSQYFFPKTCKQDSPPFHRDVWDLYENPENRYIGIEIYREGAKTTLTRLLASKRIAFGVSKFVCFVSKAEKHAIYSVDWIKRQVLNNKRWAQTFKLSLTKKSEKEIEIHHGVEGHTIRVVALGMTGQLRGFNVDDDRPDLIVGDDLDDDETAGSLTQREKQQSLFFGALIRSLVAETENPHAKAIVLQTPIDRADLIETIRRDPQFVTAVFSCFDEKGESRWPARHPASTLLKEKEAYIRRNQLSIWMREMECQVIPSETRTFKAEWLQYHEEVPEDCVFYMGIDPATDSERDDACPQAAMMIGVKKGKIYIDEYTNVKGQTPLELLEDIYRMFLKRRPIAIGVETIAFQRMLAWYIREESRKRGIYLPIIEVQDRQSKVTRITDAVSQTAANGNLSVHLEHKDFISQYLDMPDPDAFDLLDAFSIARKVINPEYLIHAVPDTGHVNSVDHEDAVVIPLRQIGAP